jgi:toxin ParE1/3/4
MIVELTNAAEADLESIGDYIARDNPVRALDFVHDFHCNFLDIAEMPLAPSVMPRFEHHGIRRRVHGRYLVFHRVGARRKCSARRVSPEEMQLVCVSHLSRCNDSKRV